MSLKAIKQAVEALREGSSQSCGRGDGCWACEDMETVGKALEAIAALENAARVLGVFGWLTIIEEKGDIFERKAVSVLKRIAKEAE